MQKLNIWINNYDILRFNKYIIYIIFNYKYILKIYKLIN